METCFVTLAMEVCEMECLARHLNQETRVSGLFRFNLN